MITRVHHASLAALKVPSTLFKESRYTTDPHRPRANTGGSPTFAKKQRRGAGCPSGSARRPGGGPHKQAVASPCPPAPPSTPSTAQGQDLGNRDEAGGQPGQRLDRAAAQTAHLVPEPGPMDGPVRASVPTQPAGVSRGALGGEAGGRGHSREGPDAPGGVPDVPHLYVGGGHREHEPRVAAVLDGDHVVGVTFQGRDLLPRDQVPHLTAAVCERARGRAGEGTGVSTQGGRSTAGGRARESEGRDVPVWRQLRPGASANGRVLPAETRWPRLEPGPHAFGACPPTAER